jgi:hypothetical protein
MPLHFRFSFSRATAAQVVYTRVCFKLGSESYVLPLVWFRPSIPHTLISSVSLLRDQSSMRSVSERFIYGLYDPRQPEIVMVVGETKQLLRQRLNAYISYAQFGLSRPSLDWVRKLLSEDARPAIRLLATTSVKNWRRCERRFITIWRKRNLQLLNVHRGGNGHEGTATKLICEKCGSKRRRVRTRATFYCPTCANEASRQQRRTPEYRKWHRSYQRKWRHTQKGRTSRYEWWRRYVSKRSNRMKANAWNRDYRYARKLGLTVAEYRAAISKS